MQNLKNRLISIKTVRFSTFFIPLTEMEIAENLNNLT